MDTLAIAQELVNQGFDSRDVAIVAPSDVSAILKVETLLSMRNDYLYYFLQMSQIANVELHLESLRYTNPIQWRQYIVNGWRLIRVNNLIKTETLIHPCQLVFNNFRWFQLPDSSIVVAKTHDFQMAQHYAANYGFSKIPKTAKQPAFEGSVAQHIGVKRYDCRFMLNLYSFFNEASTSYQVIASFAPKEIHEAFNDPE